MRASVLSAVIWLGLILAIWPQSGRTQSDRDFVFTEDSGHLIIRFAGTAAIGLNPAQANEILNAEFSQMVHDRLRADLLFEDEPREGPWALSMELQIEQHIRHAGHEFSDLFIECRAATCRVIMEQPVHWSVPEHQIMLETVQENLDAFIAMHAQHFEPVFMITAYYKESVPSHIKAFLRRAGHSPPDRPTGG